MPSIMQSVAGTLSPLTIPHFQPEALILLQLLPVREPVQARISRDIRLFALLAWA